MTGKEKTIKELKEALDSLDITNKYRLNLIRAIEYLQDEPVSEELEKAADKYSNTDYNYFDVLVTEYDGTQHLMDDKVFIKDAFKAGAKWQKEHFWKPSDEMLEALYRVIPENVMEKSEDEMLLDKLYQGLKYGKVLSEK